MARSSAPEPVPTPQGAPSALARATLWLAVVPLLAIGVTGIGGLLAIRSASQTVFYTREVLRVSRHVAALLADRETGLRGYLLTGDSTALEPELAARAALPAKLDTLASIPRDPAQRARAQAVRAAVDRWDREFARPVLAAPLPRGVALAREMAAGKPLFDLVRARTGEFIAAEERLWAQRVRRDRVITDSIVVAFALEVVLLGALYFLIRRRLMTAAATVLEQRGKLERQLEAQTALAAELRRANEELESFSYSVAHDLRAPLRSVNGFAQILREDYGVKLDAEGRELLQRILANTARAGALIDGLLALTRLRRGDLRSERVDLAGIARAVLEDLRRAAPHRAIEVRIAAPLVARGDPRLLTVVMQNLIGNAWKFTRDQAAPLIEVGEEEQNGGLAYFVKDNGVGFDPAYAGQLFAAFHRLHREHEFEGTGIGLATVRRIVERHGGRVWAEGTPGRGATFYFTLRA